MAAAQVPAQDGGRDADPGVSAPGGKQVAASQRTTWLLVAIRAPIFRRVRLPQGHELRGQFKLTAQHALSMRIGEHLARMHARPQKSVIRAIGGAETPVNEG